MKPFIALVAAIAAALFLTSCTGPASDGHTDADGSESSAAAPAESPAPNNAADVTFVTGMIPHHEQAVEMSDLVPQRSTDPAVIKLASGISAAQGPEIQTMKVFLVQWNADTDTGHEGHEGGMDGMEMQGMVDEATMTRLESLKGAEFDKLWLQSMIGHHEGAIAMANTEIADGANTDAKTLAKQIVTVQQAEIGQMKQMLGG
ncbi:MAG TPA: DUF305 domain-containing protein [Mycobacterium sp.]|nr:DUF305 domain-containing protein [Mycobacterium sp.]